MIFGGALVQLAFCSRCRPCTTVVGFFPVGDAPGEFEREDDR